MSTFCWCLPFAQKPETQKSAECMQKEEEEEMGMAAQQLIVQVSSPSHALHGADDDDHLDLAISKLLLPQKLTVSPVLDDSSGAAGVITITGLADKKQQLAVACLLQWTLNCPNPPPAATAAAVHEPFTISVRCFLFSCCCLLLSPVFAFVHSRRMNRDLSKPNCYTYDDEPTCDRCCCCCYCMAMQL